MSERQLIDLGKAVHKACLYGQLEELKRLVPDTETMAALNRLNIPVLSQPA